MCHVIRPYSYQDGDIGAYAKELTRVALDHGITHVTPHLYLTQVLDESNPEQRKIGMAAGIEILKQCQYILIGSRKGLSEGMLDEIEEAYDAGLIELAITKHGLEKVYKGGQDEKVF